MEDQITVNGRVLSIRRLLGKGKGGYSYLAADERGEYVVKQIHHEPCEYYQFGDKLAAEQRDYERLLSAGIPMPRLLDVDTENERILKEYIPGPTAAELIAENRLPGFCLRQLKAMCAPPVSRSSEYRLLSDQFRPVRRPALLRRLRMQRLQPQMGLRALGCAVLDGTRINGCGGR